MSKQPVYKKASDLLEQDKQFVLALITAKQGSGPRSPGAKVLIGQDGVLAGTIGGGALEEMVTQKSQRLLRGDSDGPLTISTNLSEIDMYCGGAVSVWLRKVTSEELAFYKKVAELCRQNQPLVIARVIGATDHQLEQLVGQHIIVTSSGETYSSTGVETLDKLVLRKYGGVLERRSPCNLTTTGEDLGLDPSVELDLFLEPVHGSPQLIIIGAGHVGFTLAQLSSFLGLFEITVLDKRQNYLSGREFPNNVVVTNLEDGYSNIPELGSNSFVVVATHSHETDQRALRAIYSRNSLPRYLGMVGSSNKAQTIKDNLSQSGLDKNRLKDLHTPIGLSIGGNTPEEIAVSILAEVIQVKNS